MWVRSCRRVGGLRGSASGHATKGGRKASAARLSPLRILVGGGTAGRDPVPGASVIWARLHGQTRSHLQVDRVVLGVCERARATPSRPVWWTAFRRGCSTRTGVAVLGYRRRRVHSDGAPPTSAGVACASRRRSCARCGSEASAFSRSSRPQRRSSRAGWADNSATWPRSGHFSAGLRRRTGPLCALRSLRFSRLVANALVVLMSAHVSVSASGSVGGLVVVSIADVADVIVDASIGGGVGAAWVVCVAGVLQSRGRHCRRKCWCQGRRPHWRRRRRRCRCWLRRRLHGCRWLRRRCRSQGRCPHRRRRDGVGVCRPCRRRANRRLHPSPCPGVVGVGVGVGAGD